MKTLGKVGSNLDISAKFRNIGLLLDFVHLGLGRSGRILPSIGLPG